MARKKAVVTVVPKRRIERVKAIINGTVGTSLAQKIMHVAEDSHTLVRMLLDISFLPVSPQTDENLELASMVSVHPQGTEITAPSLTGALDVVVPLQEITSVIGGLSKAFTTSGNYGTTGFRWQVDTKAMRKLKEGDEVTLAYIGNVNTSFLIRGIVYLWFKE